MDLLKAQTKTLPGGDGPGADMVKVVEQATADAIAELTAPGARFEIGPITYRIGFPGQDDKQTTTTTQCFLEAPREGGVQ